MSLFDKDLVKSHSIDKWFIKKVLDTIQSLSNSSWKEAHANYSISEICRAIENEIYKRNWLDENGELIDFLRSLGISATFTHVEPDLDEVSKFQIHVRANINGKYTDIVNLRKVEI